MFLGTFAPRLDEKNRLVLPAKFRDELSGGLVITRGQERCLYVFGLADFTARTQHLRGVSLADKNARDYKRMLFAEAHDEVPDRQGRVSIPAGLRGYAGLTRDLAVIGANDHLEIWDAGSWTDYAAAQEDTFAALSEGGVDATF
jgi:MraZ protein